VFIHAADAHLGISRYSKADPVSGLNLRSMDFLHSFNELCDKVVEMEPDMFLFCGDLFDRVNPTNYMRRAVQEQFMRLSRAKVDTVVISGNHETPRSKGVSNPLVLYKDIEHIHVVLYPRQLQIGDYWINAIPYTAHPQKHMAAPKANCISILMMHTTIEGAKVGSERYMCFEEAALKRSEIPGYDYTALGHIHKAQDLSSKDRRIFYSGSLERYDFNEVNERKGFYVVGSEPEFIEVSTREMMSKPLDVEGLTGYEITENCLSILENMDVSEKVVRLELVGNMKDLERNSINYAQIRECAIGASHFTIVDRTIANQNLRIREDKVIFSPYAELERYLKMTENFSEALYERGSKVIEGRIER